jgi:hypothetical protein
MGLIESGISSLKNSFFKQAEDQNSTSKFTQNK